MNEPTEKNGLEPGAILGKYRVDSLVGKGGMGEVYAVTHVELGRRAAIKTLLPEFVSNLTVLRRFRREAQMAASIGHDNICEVLDIASTEDGTTYMVMPLLFGHTFAELIEQKTLSLETIVDIVAQTLSGLEAAHREQIVHRDLKPENIFVTRVGDRENFAKLLDFGISKIIDQEVVSKLTKTGTLLGTPYYMSPEQARGESDIDLRADIYAMGVILYEAITGFCPFEGTTHNQVIYKILLHQFSAPREVNPSVPKSIEQVVFRALSYDPAERYSSAGEMRSALNAALEAAGEHGYRSAEPLEPGSERESVDNAKPQPLPDVTAMFAGGVVDSPDDAAESVTQHGAGSDTLRSEPSSQTALGEPGAARDSAMNGRATRREEQTGTPLETVMTAPSVKRPMMAMVLGVVALLLGVVVYVLLEQRGGDDAMVIPAASPAVEEQLPARTPTADRGMKGAVENPPELSEDALADGDEVDTDTAASEPTPVPREPAKKAAKVSTPPRAKERTRRPKPQQKVKTTDEKKVVEGRFGTKFTSDY